MFGRMHGLLLIRKDYESGAAQAAYMDPGFVAANSAQVEQATQSWETGEYQKDWGLTAMNASTAYALGFNGSGVAVGIMDSGALMQIHPDLAGDRFHAVTVKDQSYGSSGNRYPQHTVEDGLYNPDSEVPESGQWQSVMNDSHGTHVTGTVGGNRDGSQFHGVAWGADIYVGNTGGTDDTNYGPFQDPQFFYEGWSAIAEDISNANRFEDGTTRGGFINNSFGTNLRVVANNSTGTDDGNTSIHFPTDSVSQTEYEYFLFQQDAQNRQNEDARWNGLSFVDAAFEAVKDKKVVQVFTTGNRDFANPFYRPLYPYFNPEAENYWVAVAGIQQGSDGTYQLQNTYNEAGNAKWWTVSAPAVNIYSSKVNLDTGEPTWGNSSGTSMAAPHVTGALAVLMSRYEQMDALQVRDVMLTTTTHTNPDGSTFAGWTAAKGEVDERYGWGMPDLEKGMYGPGQLLGTFDYNLRGNSLDVWTNDISEVALDQRETEDKAWLAAAEKWMKNPTLTLGSEYTAEEKELLGDIILNTTDDIVGMTDEQEKISEEDAIAWRKAYYQKRIDAINARAYDGSLIKRGTGMLVMTGSNTYEGGTTVEEGTLVGFTESFGKGDVVVNGGAFGIIKHYDDQFTKTGSKDSNESRKANVVMHDGGTYLVSAGEDVNVGKLDFQKGSAVSVWTNDADALVSVYTEGTKLTGAVTADALTGEAVAKSHLAFFDVTATTKDNTLTATLEKKQGGMAAVASTANGRAIGAAIESNTESEFFKSFIGATTTEAQNTFSTLGSDELLNASTASIMNTVTLTRAVQEQAQGIGSGRFVEMADGTARIWATGIGSWGEVDFGQSSIDNDFYAGLIGAEVDVCPAAKIGVFFGAGTTETKGDGKLESDDIHFGAYAVSNVADVAAFNFGFTYTKQDRDGHRALTVGSETAVNSITSDAGIAQIFAEAAYTGFNTDAYSVEPYVGFSWMHVSTDDFDETVGTHTFRTDNENQNLQMTTLGIRGALPFTVGSMRFSVKGDLSWMHFFGDTSPEASLQLADAGTAFIKGGELDDLVGVSLGVEANLTKSTTFGLSYTGAYNGDVNSSGLYANVRFAF